MKNNKSAIILLVLGSCGFYFFLGHIQGTWILLTEKFINSSFFNDVVSAILVICGFTFCGYQLIKPPLTASRGIKAYFASAIAMGGVYYTINLCDTSCFYFSAQSAEKLSVFDFVYFSFVTVTTVGFGDITPMHTFIRLLVVFQILFGLMLILKINTGEFLMSKNKKIKKNN